MTARPIHNPDENLPEPQGHAIGFVKSQSDCDAVINALTSAGFSDSAITVLEGEDGIHLLKKMLSGSLWGETAEDVLKQGVIEISRGHLAVIVDAEDRQRALLAANISKQYGGYSFSHFGLLTDERLTR